MACKNVVEYLKLETIELDLKSKNKVGVIKELYENLKTTGLIKDEEQALKDLYSREEMGTTGIGRRVGFPHAKTDTVDEIMLTVGISKEGIDYNAIDAENVNIFFMFLCPRKSNEEYLRILARISRWVREENFTKNLINAKTKEEIVEIIRRAESIG